MIRSLTYEAEIKKYLESDRFIQAVLDNKTLDMGDQSRFKTEIVLDAQLITRHFLNTEVDVDAMLVVCRTDWLKMKIFALELTMSCFCPIPW